MTLPSTSQTAMLGLIGQTIDSYCDGWFGRDSYGEKTIEAVGPDWIVCRNEAGRCEFATGLVSFEELYGHIKKWQRDG